MADKRKPLLPGWEWVRFGDVVRLCTDRCADPTSAGIEKYVGLEHLEPSDLRIRSWGLVADGVTFTNQFKAGQVLFGKRRAYQRKVAVAAFDGVCSGDIYVFEPANSRLHPELLPFLCQSNGFFQHALKTSAGSLSPRTNWSSLADYEFALPPLSEQVKIAGVLQRLALVGESYQEVIAQVQTSQAALLDEFMSRASTMTTVADVTQDSAYGCSSLATSEPVGDPIIRIPNVLRGELDLSDLKYVKLSPAEVDRFRIKPGELAVVRTNGNPDYVGRCVVIPEVGMDLLLASYLIRLTADTQQVEPQFLADAINSHSVRRLLRGSVRSSAGNYNVNTKGLLSLRFPLPTLSDQRKYLSQRVALKAVVRDVILRRTQLDQVRVGIPMGAL